MASVWTQAGHSPLCSDTQQGVSNNELITGVGQNMLTESRVLYMSTVVNSFGLKPHRGRPIYNVYLCMIIINSREAWEVIHIRNL